MGRGADMDGCGQFMKYSMFFSNFIIFVSCILIRIYFSMTFFLVRLGWRAHSTWNRSVDACRQGVHQRTSRHQPLHGHGLHSYGHWGDCGSPCFFRLPRCSERNQVSPAISKCRLSI